MIRLEYIHLTMKAKERGTYCFICSGRKSSLLSCPSLSEFIHTSMASEINQDSLLLCRI